MSDDGRPTTDRWPPFAGYLPSAMLDIADLSDGSLQTALNQMQERWDRRIAAFSSPQL
ncbi:MAG: hypothetical protein WAU10_26705 [Caldilineaceae bacterium]